MAGDILVGCCGFPVARSRYYGEFDAVELQDTFYQMPRPELAARRRQEADDSRPAGDFVFTLKAWQLITHPATSPTYRRLREPLGEGDRAHCGFFRLTPPVRDAWERTMAVARTLRAPLLVLQCPPSFKPQPDHLSNLRTLLTSAPRDGLTLAWEPRGRWDEGLVRDLCHELNLVHCVDPFAASSQWGELAYFRLHGIGGYRYRYSDDELRRLREMCEEELAKGRRPVYVMFNNVYMLEDARRFREIVHS